MDKTLKHFYLETTSMLQSPGNTWKTPPITLLPASSAKGNIKKKKLKTWKDYLKYIKKKNTQRKNAISFFFTSDSDHKKKKSNSGKMQLIHNFCSPKGKREAIF